MRIQFLVAAHNEPVLLTRLSAQLQGTGEHGVTVQWDCSAPGPEPLLAPGVEMHRTQRPVRWGDGSQLDALLDSFELLRSAEFDWLVMLSGQDYPIRPMGELAAHLEHTPHDLFLDTPPLSRVEDPTSQVAPWTYLQHRYFRQYRWVPQRAWSALPHATQRLLGAAMKRAAAILSPQKTFIVQRRTRGESPAIATRSRTPPFTAAMPCRSGSDWFAMSRPVFDDLARQIGDAPELVRYFRGTFHPMEAFLHTLLLPEWEAGNAGHNLHYLRFVGTRSHPETLSEADLGTCVESRRFFARKFTATDQTVLDRIDRELLISPRHP